ncbi:ATP-grasp domain-containing protein [Actinomycetaceae bacterium L2_0104]
MNTPDPATTSNRPGSRPILPVVFGFDIADYAFARIFHEAVGVRSLVISEILRGPINNSKIFDLEMVAKGTLGNEEKFIALLHRIAAEHPDEQLILCVNSDEGVDYAARHRAELEDRWFLPYAPAEAVETANSKRAMAEFLSSLGFAVPERVTVDLADPESWRERLEKMTFPVVVKPEDGTDVTRYHRQGLQKAMPVESMDEALATFGTWSERGVHIRLIVQELIPGDDTTQWVVNGYVDSRGEVTATGSGRVLLGLHQPQLVGNAAMILVQSNEELIADAQRIVLAAGMRGFFSMDVKIDPRTGTAYWLDLNPRIGRGHYYLKVGGIDLASAMLADMEGRVPSYQTNERDGIYTVIPMCLANRTYLRDETLYTEVKRVRRARRAINPLTYSKDRNPKRTLYRVINLVNQWRQMRACYPKPTESGF